MWISKKRYKNLRREIVELRQIAKYQKFTIEICEKVDMMAKEAACGFQHFGKKECIPIEDVCVFHWLDCLYQDYLNGAVVGLDNPCNSCPKLGECNVSAITNFNLAGKKYDLKVGEKTG